MPKMISLRNFRLASTSGHVILFEAKVPRDVHPDVVREALSHGCGFADQADAEGAAPDDDARLRAGYNDALRRSLIYSILARVIKTNDPKQFDSGKMPKAEVITKVLGIELGKDELKTAWQALQNANSTGEDLSLHPDTQKVLDILDSESKADLLLVAQEQGFSQDEVHGLQPKDLRKHLLARYALAG
jgi:hypothetical protein